MRHLLWIVLLLAGCSSPPTSYTFAFEGLEDDYQTAVAAAASWEECHVVTSHVFLGSAFKEDVKIAYSDTVYRESITSSIGGKYYYPPENSIEYTHKGTVKIVLMHEMGHAFGLDHFGDGVMNPSPWATDVTPEDCDALRHR